MEQNFSQRKQEAKKEFAQRLTKLFIRCEIKKRIKFIAKKTRSKVEVLLSALQNFSFFAR